MIGDRDRFEENRENWKMKTQLDVKEETIETAKKILGPAVAKLLGDGWAWSPNKYRGAWIVGQWDHTDGYCVRLAVANGNKRSWRIFGGSILPISGRLDSTEIGTGMDQSADKVATHIRNRLLPLFVPSWHGVRKNQIDADARAKQCADDISGYIDEVNVKNWTRNSGTPVLKIRLGEGEWIDLRHEHPGSWYVESPAYLTDAAVAALVNLAKSKS